MRLFPLLGLAAAATMLHAQEQEAEDVARPPGTIVRAKGTIVVDGKLDEADWKNARPVAAQYVRGKKNVLGESPRMTVRYLWDDAYLYIGYEVFDTNLVAAASGVMDGPPNNRRMGCLNSSTNLPVDVVEFLIAFEDPCFLWQIQLNASNQLSDALCVTGLPAWQKTRIALADRGIYWAWGESIQDEGARTLASAVSLTPRADGKPSTVNDAADCDTGYTGELRLPWYGIGASAADRTGEHGQPGPWKMANRAISILAVVQDGEDPAHCQTTAPATTIDFFGQQAGRFPRYVLRAAGQWAW